LAILLNVVADREPFKADLTSPPAALHFLVMHLALAALLIFALRVTDVSIGTLRVLYAVRGRRLAAAGSLFRVRRLHLRDFPAR
jgi:hypothetical protein